MIKAITVFIITILLMLTLYTGSAGQLSVSFDTAYVNQYQHYKIFAVLQIQNNSTDTAFINKSITETFVFTSSNMNDTMVKDSEINAVMFVDKERFPDRQNKFLETKRMTPEQYTAVEVQEQAFYKRNKGLAATDFTYIIQPGQAIKIHALLVSDITAYDKGFIRKLVKEDVQISYWFRLKYNLGKAATRQKWFFCADSGHFSRAYFEQLSKLK